MKFKTKEEVIKETKHDCYNDDIQEIWNHGMEIGVESAFKSFKERLELYVKYKDSKFLLQEDNEDLYELYYKSRCLYFNVWLFDYCFGDIYV